MAAIEIELVVVAPIALELGAAPTTYIGTALAGPQGLPGSAVTIGWGERKTGVDAGTLKELSIGDDYLYICVVAGEVGVAVWKKSVLFQT